jgi:2-oxoisovalerate dehydrogenase E1 component alpha subunit
MIKRRCFDLVSSHRLLFRRLLSSSSTVELADDTSTQHTTTGPIATTTTLEIVDSKDKPKWPVFRVLDPQGHLIEGVDLPEIDYAVLVKKYEVMGKIRAFDDIMYNAQRQGRISFYMQNLGEEVRSMLFALSSLF